MEKIIVMLFRVVKAKMDRKSVTFRRLKGLEPYSTTVLSSVESIRSYILTLIKIERFRTEINTVGLNLCGITFRKEALKWGLFLSATTGHSRIALKANDFYLLCTKMAEPFLTLP